MMTSCIQYLEETVQKYPDKIAVKDGVKDYNYSELKKNALKIARCIPEKNHNAPIAVFLPKSSNSIVAFLGVLYSGNFYIPLDVKSPQERLFKVLNNIEPACIITNKENKEKILDWVNDSVLIIDFDEAINFSEESTYNYIARINNIIDTDPVYCIYTSGSSGTPKGVIVPHRGLIDFIEWVVDCYKINHETIFGNQSPFVFDVSVLDIYASIKCGATLYIIPEFLFAFPPKLMEFVDQEKINFIIWVPSVMINVANAQLFSNKEYKHLNKILFAGEVMPNKQLNYWRKHIPNALYSNLYGPTEASVIACYYIIDRAFNDNDLLPIGFPCKNAELLVLNQENKKAEMNELGELCIRGSLLAFGYWNDSEKTNSAFVQNPLNNHYPERIYRTGDLVKYNERGEIMYLGRKDSQIKHMGYRIELGEIENAILSIGGIDNSCVLYDSGKRHIILFFEARNPEIADAYIRKTLVNILPKYMIPTLFIKLEEMPLNVNGKIDRAKLKKEYC